MPITVVSKTLFDKIVQSALSENSRQVFPGDVQRLFELNPEAFTRQIADQSYKRDYLCLHYANHEPAVDLYGFLGFDAQDFRLVLIDEYKPKRCRSILTVADPMLGRYAWIDHPV